MKFTSDRPFADPEAAFRKLLQLILRNDIDVGQYTNVGKVNQDFFNAGGNVAEDSIGRDYAIGRRWFELDRSGSRIILLKAGANLESG
jgi:hypothetical protein